MIERHGLFRELDTDRGSRHIAAYSPEASANRWLTETYVPAPHHGSGQLMRYKHRTT
jgi:hypothetical protein